MSSTTHRHSRVDPLGRVLLLALLLALTWSGFASAEKRPIIESGREKDALALLAPYQLGKDVSAGYRLWKVEIQATQILVQVQTEADSEPAGFELRHLEFSKSDTRSKSFAIELDDAARDGPAGPALALLVAAVQRNDTGGFWRVERGTASGPGQDATVVRKARSFFSDGIVLLGLLTLLLFALAFRTFRAAPRWVGPGLLGVVVVGGLLRFWLSPVTVLGAWPYSRIGHTARLVFEGPLLANWTASSAQPIYLTDVSHLVTFYFAILAPIALYVHARYLIGDARIALLAAALLAFLPAHLRFARSEVAFVSSLVISSTCLALTHAALRDPSRLWRWSATALLPLLVWGMMLVRPLNALFVGVIFGVAWLARRELPRLRVMIVILLASGSGAISAVSHLTGSHSSQVSEGLSLSTLWGGLGVLVDPVMNTLINPWITPPLFVLLAAAGAASLWRTRRGLVILLLGWLLVFILAHAYVVPPRVEMQARYHLHLIVPFLLLVAVGVGPLLRFTRLPGAIWTLAAYVVLSPALHYGFISDIGFNDQAEYGFVSGLREQIPEGCTVLEFVGRDSSAHDARLGRIGRRLKAGTVGNRYRVQPIGSDVDPLKPLAPGKQPLAPEALEILAEPPECLMVYVGLPCAGVKPMSEPQAPACAVVRRAFPLELVDQVSFPNHFYDKGMARGLQDDVGQVSLSLSRARPR